MYIIFSKTFCMLYVLNNSMGVDRDKPPQVVADSFRCDHKGLGQTTRTRALMCLLDDHLITYDHTKLYMHHYWFE